MSRFSNVAGSLAAIAVASMIPATARAAVTFYTSSSAFEAAAGSLAVEDYGAYSAGDLIANGGALGALTYDFQTGADLGGVITNLYASFSGNGLAAKEFTGPLNPGDFFIFNEGFTVTFPTAVTAAGIFWNVFNPVDFTFDTSNGDHLAQTATDPHDTKSFDFIGVVSDTPFASVTFNSSIYTIPKIEYSGSAAAAPEPGTWAILLLGLAGAGASLRRSRRLRTAPSST